MSNVKDFKEGKTEVLVGRIISNIQKLDDNMAERAALWWQLGDDLTALKAVAGHCNWSTYVSQELPLSDSQCRRYMAFRKEFKDPETLGAKRFASLDDALGFIDKRKAKRKERNAQAEAEAKRQQDAKERAAYIARHKEEFIKAKGEDAWAAEEQRMYDEYWEENATQEERDHRDRCKARQERINEQMNDEPLRNEASPDELQAYRVLGLYPVNDVVLKAAFHAMAKVHHPDNFTEGTEAHKEAEEIMKELNLARATLTPPRKLQ